VLPVATTGRTLIHLDFLLTGIVMTFLGPMLPILATRWSLSDAKSGSLIFAQFFGSLLGLFASGVLVEQRGYRQTLVVGALLMASGMALLASGPWVLGVISVAILGIGHGITTPAGNLMTAENYPERSAAALNVLNSMWGVGAMSTPFLVAMAVHAGHPPFFLYGTAMALLVLWLGLLLVRFAAEGQTTVVEKAAAMAFWKAPLLSRVCLLFFIYVGTETSIGEWLATYARRVQSGDHSLATMTPSFYWGALLVGRAFAPVVLSFVGEITFARIGLSLALIGGMMLLLAPTMALLITSSVLAGLGLASIFPISVSLFSRWFGALARRVSGVVFASGTLGAATVPWAMGAVSTHYSSLRSAFSMPLLGVLFMLAFYAAEAAQRPSEGFTQD
jgi:FHS family glucose/mannose:H+ symporter-like MFS transporter